MNKFICLTVVTLAAVSIQEDVEFEPLPDYYSLLKVSPTAKTHEIKKSFRKLAMKYHPDKNKDELAQGIFQELSEAYSILSDAEKRRDYDELFLDEDELAEQYATGDSPASSPSEDTLKQTSLNEAANDAPDSSDTANANEQEDSAESSGEDVWDDIDDETLYKVLKFLADNDYEITKKTTKAESDFTNFNTNRHENHDRHMRSRRSSEYMEFQEEPIHYRYQADGQRYQPYAKPHDFDATGHDTGRRNSGHSYCRTSVRWEGGVKVTNKSCY